MSVMRCSSTKSPKVDFISETEEPVSMCSEEDSWARGMSMILRPFSTAGLKLYLQVWMVRFMGLFSDGNVRFWFD